MNEKGILGVGMATLIMTIVIVFILIGFVLLSGVVKVIGVHGDKSTIIKDFSSYSESYKKLLYIRYLVQKGNAVEDAINIAETEGRQNE